MSWGGVAIGVGSVVGGLISANGAQNAADAQSDAAAQAARIQKYIFDKQVQLQKPFRAAGLDAQQRLMLLLGLGGDKSREMYGLYGSRSNFGMDDFQKDPGYAFRMKEGLKALDRQAAARGGLISGGALKAAERYGQNVASEEYMNAYNRYQQDRANALNPLFSILGYGQQATNQLQNAGSDYARGATENAYQMGNARASSYAGQASAWNNALSGIGNGVNYYLSNRQPGVQQWGYGQGIPGTTPDQG